MRTKLQIKLTPSKSAYAASGFTLIEVLMAIVLGGILISGASYFLSSVGEMHFLNQTRIDYPQHAANVTRHLGHLLLTAEAETQSQRSNATQAPLDQTQNRNQNTPKTPFSWDRPSDRKRQREAYLSFGYEKFTPMLGGSQGPPKPLHIFIAHDYKEGLALYWEDSNREKTERPEVFQTLLSPYVSDIIYHFYDKEKERWEEGAQVMRRKGTLPLPDRIELRFQFPDESEIELFITVPKALERPLLF